MAKNLCIAFQLCVRIRINSTSVPVFTSNHTNLQSAICKQLTGQLRRGLHSIRSLVSYRSLLNIELQQKRNTLRRVSYMKMPWHQKGSPMMADDSCYNSVHQRKVGSTNLWSRTKSSTTWNANKPPVASLWLEKRRNLKRERKIMPRPLPNKWIRDVCVKLSFSRRTYPKLKCWGSRVWM